LIIRIDQQSLKYMVQQRLADGIQHKLLMNLLEFDYTIEYKRGVENAVAGALSREDHTMLAISLSVFFAPERYRVVKIMCSCSEVVL
jgi:hypothetical protein